MAVDQARKGLEANEVPVGCVFVHQPSGKVLAESHNLTNQTKNVRKANLTSQATTHCEVNCIREICRNGDKALLPECTLYVTVEPCIMCAYALKLSGIRKVVFGCENDKFGGNGSILSLQKLGGGDYEIT